MGKAYRIPSATDRLRKQQIDIRNLQAQNRNRNTPRAVAATAFSGISAAGSTGGGTGNFLPLLGGSMFGNIAFDPDTVAIINGRIDLEPSGNPTKNSTNILVSGQGTPDDVRFIDNAERNGQLLLYQGTNQTVQNLLNAKFFSITNIVGTGATNIITVTVASTTGLSNGDQVDVFGTTNFNKQDAVVADLTATTFTYDLGETGSATPESSGDITTGNIFTNSGSTIVLDGTLSSAGAPRIILIFDNTAPAGGGWRPATTSEGGGGGISFPITPPVNVLGSVGSNQNLDLSLTTAHTHSLTLTASIDITFSNFPTATNQLEWEVEVTQDGTGGHVITWPAEVVNPPTLPTTADSITVVVFRTNDNGVTVRVANTVTTAGGNVPDGTAQFQHLEWDGAAWIAQQALAFGVNSASSAQLNIPNDTIGLAWSNATFNGDIQLKTTTTGVLDLTRSDNTAMSFTIRAQNMVEADQTLNFTVGSGSVTTADCVIDASTAKLLIGAGGANRITLDTTSITDLTLKSVSGVTAQSAFNVVSTHVSDPDSRISLSVGSGTVANTEGNLETTGALLSFSAGGSKRLTLDTTTITDLTLKSPSFITAQSAFNVTSTHVSEADSRITLSVGSGDPANSEGNLETTAGILSFTAGGAKRLEIDVNIGTEITQTAIGINPVYDLFHDTTPNDNDIIGTINFSADNSTPDKKIFASIFVESNDVTAGTEDSSIFLSTITAGLLGPKLTISPTTVDVSSTVALFRVQSGTTSIDSGVINIGNSNADNIHLLGLINADILSSAAGVNLGNSTGNEFISLFLAGSVFLGNTTTQRISADAGGMNLDIPSGDIFDFRINGTTAIQILADGTLNMSNEDIDNIGDLIFATSTQIITGNSGGIDYRVPTSDTHDFFVNNVSTFLIEGSQVRVPSTVTQLLVESGTTSINSSTINFGDSTADRINWIARWQFAFIPAATNTYDIGTAALRVREIFSNNVLNVSFSEFKHDIVTLDDADCMGVCDALDTIEYRWNDDMYKIDESIEDDSGLTRKYVGFNADALKEMMPNAVKDDMVYTNSVIGVLLGSVRYLKKRIQELENQMTIS